MLVLAPIEILLAIGVFFIVFYVFRKLLNGKRLNKVIDEVMHPTPVSEDEIVETLDRTKQVAVARADETDAEIKRRQTKAERLRRAYGG